MIIYNFFLGFIINWTHNFWISSKSALNHKSNEIISWILLYSAPLILIGSSTRIGLHLPYGLDIEGTRGVGYTLFKKESCSPSRLHL